MLTLYVCVLCLIIRFIYETEHFNGVAELLEILGRFVPTDTLLHWKKANFVVYHGLMNAFGCWREHTHTQDFYTQTHSTWPAAPIYETAVNPVNGTTTKTVTKHELLCNCSMQKNSMHLFFIYHHPSLFLIR